MAINSAGVEYEAVPEPYAETENSVDNRKDVSDRLLRIHNVISNRFWQFAALSGLMFVLGIIGLVLRLASGFDDKDVWGFYVAVFAFLITLLAFTVFYVYILIERINMRRIEDSLDEVYQHVSVSR